MAGTATDLNVVATVVYSSVVFVTFLVVRQAVGARKSRSGLNILEKWKFRVKAEEPSV